MPRRAAAGRPPGRVGPLSAGPGLPLATGVAALAGCLVVAVADPAVPGRYGFCPFAVATGWWCPLCGSLRAVHHLLNGELAAAAGSNLLLVAALPALVYAWTAWTLPRLGLRGPPRLRPAPGVWWAALGALLLFGIVRNLSAFAWLAPERLWPAG